MDYFEAFPKITIYDKYLITDITRRMYIQDKFKNKIGIFDEYIVKDGDTPESIAWKFYGNPNYHWVILLMNDIIDPFYDFPLSDNELSKFVTDTYGAGNENSPHHYELNGVVVDANTPNAAPISNFEYEYHKNEEKRKIKILKPEFVGDLEDSLITGI